MEHPKPPQHRASIAHAPASPVVRVHDLLSLFHAPLFFRVPFAALRPARLVLAALLLACLALLLQTPELFRKDGEAFAAPSLVELLQQQLSLANDHSAARAYWPGFLSLLRTPVAMLANHPTASLVLALPAVMLVALLGGSIARSASLELALRTREPWHTSLAFGFARFGQFVMTFVLPTLAVAGLVGLLALLGWGLLASDTVAPVGGVLFFAPLFVAGLLVVVLTITLLSLPMLHAALVCEGTDSIDALQRCWAYAAARPARIAFYCVVLALQLVAMLFILHHGVDLVLRLCAWSTTLWIGPERGVELREAITTNSPRLSREGGTVAPAALAGVSFWCRALRLFAPAYAVSFVMTAGPALYLTLRKLCDGQDPSDIWEPGKALIQDAQVGDADSEDGD